MNGQEPERVHHIKLKIGSSNELSLKISSPRQEALFRRAADEVNAKISMYRSKYPDNTIEDFLSMTAFLFALRTLELEAEKKDDPLRKEVDDLTHRLKEYLKADN